MSKLSLGANRSNDAQALFLQCGQRSGVQQFGLGAIVMGAALFVGGCPTRILIRSGYGDVAAFVALAGVAAGIVLATLSMRWMARR